MSDPSSYSYGDFPAHSPSSTATEGAFNYDAAGDRLNDGAISVQWDALGKARNIQKGSTSVNLTYGPDGGLVDSTAQDGGRYVGKWAKWQDANDWSARIIVRGRVIAVVKDSAGSVSTNYILRGPLGSTQAVASGAGNLIKRVAYSSWGSFVQPSTGTGSVSGSSIAQYTTVTYTGHELIAGTGLINMGARLYDPSTGLFMSPDPTVAHPYDTQDLNQFAYVGGNPVTLIDPFGYASSKSPLCNANKVTAPETVPVLSSAVMTLGSTFVDAASKAYFGGDTGLSEMAAYTALISSIGINQGSATLNGMLDDIETWQRTGGMEHSMQYGGITYNKAKGLVNWYNLQVNWAGYGAMPQASGGTLASAIQTMCNFFWYVNAKKSSSGGKSGRSGEHNGPSYGGGVSYDPLLEVIQTTCYWSRGTIDGKTGPWQFGGCIGT